MMNCDWLPRVHAYYDGELGTGLRTEVEAHLRTCLPCARELDRLRALSQTLGALPAPALRSDVKARLRKTAAPILELALMRTSEYVSAAAAIILIVCGAWLWHADRTPRARPPESWESVAVAPQQADAAALDPVTDVAQWIVAGLNQGKRYE